MYGRAVRSINSAWTTGAGDGLGPLAIKVGALAADTAGMAAAAATATAHAPAAHQELQQSPPFCGNPANITQARPLDGVGCACGIGIRLGGGGRRVEAKLLPWA